MSCISTNNIKSILFDYKFQSYDLMSYSFHIHKMLLLIIMINPLSFLPLTLLVHQNLNFVLSNSFSFSPVHLVSCRYMKLIFFLTISSIIFIDFPINVFIFHVLKWIIFSWTNFFTYTRSQTLVYFSPHCNNSYSFTLTRVIHTITYLINVIEIQ